MWSYIILFAVIIFVFFACYFAIGLVCKCYRKFFERVKFANNIPQEKIELRQGMGFLHELECSMSDKSGTPCYKELVIKSILYHSQYYKSKAEDLKETYLNEAKKPIKENGMVEYLDAYIKYCDDLTEKYKGEKEQDKTP